MTITPIPAVVSTTLRDTSTTSFEVGDTFELTIQARFATFVVTEVRSRLATLPADRAFIVVPRHLLLAALTDRPLQPTSVFVRAPASVGDGLRGVLVEADVNARIESQHARLESLRQRPLVEAVESGFAVALGAAIAYAALAVVVSLVLAGTARARETAHLRTLGVNRTQIVALAVLEHAPPVVVAIVGGLALGLAVGWVVLPGLGLAAFTGAASDPVLTVDLGQLVVLTLALTVIVAIGVGLSAWVQRRTDPARVVREGIE